MPKSRKSKAKHKDFNKVKLKVGRKLPRADNETNTAFRTRDIQLREQFHSSDGSEPTTRRKLNVKELLTQCQHFSASIRRDAVSGLNELLTFHPEVISRNLSLLLERISELFVDKDSEVRTNVTKLLRVLLPGISLQNMTPFFSLLSAHLCCAMTHIYDDIKADSLSILDLCLEHYPSLVTADSSRILENFLGQISAKSHKNNKLRTLLINPNNKLTSQKWRLRVLQRIHGFLKALIQSKINGSSTNKTSMFGSCALSHHLPSYLTKPLATALSSDDPISGYIPMLVPLLLECWVEAGPSQMTSNLPGNALSEESMSLLYCVVSILSFLLEFVAESTSIGTLSLEDFRRQFSREIVQHLFVGFPYCMHERPRNPKQKAEKASSTVSVLTMNISVCHVMSFLWLDSRKQGPKAQMANVVTFLSSALDDRSVNAEQITLIVNVLDHLVNRKIGGTVVEPLLSSVLSVFKSRHPSSREVMAVHALFTKYAVDEFDCTSLKGSGLVSTWLSSLPGHFLSIKDDEKRSDDILRVRTLCARTMLRASAQHLEEFTPALNDSIDSMLDVAFFNTMPVSLKEAILQLTWALPNISRHRFKILTVLHQKKLIPCHLLNSLVQRLAFRFVREKSEGADLQFQCEDFISFVFSLCIGQSNEDLQSLKAKPTAFSPAIGLNPANLVENTSVAEACCSAMMNIGSEIQLSEVTLEFFSDFMVKFSTIPLSSACSILLMTKHWLPINPQIIPLQHKQWISNLLVAVATSLAPDTEFRSSILKLCLQTLLASDVLKSQFFNCILCCIQASSDSDCVEVILLTLNELMELSQLQNPRIFDARSSADFSTIAVSAKEKTSAKVLTSFNYNLSLLQ